MDWVFWFVPAAALLALSFAGLTARSVRKRPAGNAQMQEISGAIARGANAYLKRQYRTVALFFAAVFAVLGVLALTGFLNPFVPFAFLTGGIFSGLSGYFGMKIATLANARTAEAARGSLNAGLKVAFASGSVMGFVVVGLGLLDLSVWYCLLRYAFSLSAQEIAASMVTFSMGASSMALFARVGGGIFTKAADVGADLVGKVEAGIPEDDHRNPAVIADNVGDNVGDVAGMGADLYESYVGSILSCMALGVFAGLEFKGALAPLLVAAIGVLSSFVGSFFVRTREDASQKALLSALRKGTYAASALAAVLSFAAVYFFLGQNYLGVCFAMLSGLLGGVLIGVCTEFFTSDTYRPTQKLADSAETGPATVVIDGLSLGMLSTLLPVLIVGAVVVFSFLISGGAQSVNAGLFGIGMAAVGMLSTLGITLATDAYGPIADNAGGIAQMADLDESVRARTDALDALGNTTAATGKGFAIGSAALTALALLSSFIEVVWQQAPEKIDLAVNTPAVLVGLFIGCMLPYLFSSLTMSAVGRAASSVVREVRRQFREIPGIMTGLTPPDYARCIDLCTRSALKEMILPAVIAVVSPLIVGLFLGVNGVAGLLAGSTISGFVLAVMMSNAGGAWDNAKKYIEAGHGGGKGSPQHKAAVVGDTVGDPFKDTSGPSINILIKLLSIVSIVFAAVILAFPSLF